MKKEAFQVDSLSFWIACHRKVSIRRSRKRIAKYKKLKESSLTNRKAVKNSKTKTQYIGCKCTLPQFTLQLKEILSSVCFAQVLDSLQRWTSFSFSTKKKLKKWKLVKEFKMKFIRKPLTDQNQNLTGKYLTIIWRRRRVFLASSPSRWNWFCSSVSTS